MRMMGEDESQAVRGLKYSQSNRTQTLGQRLVSVLMHVTLTPKLAARHESAHHRYDL